MKVFLLNVYTPKGADSGPDPPPNRQICVTLTPISRPHFRYGLHTGCVDLEVSSVIGTLSHGPDLDRFWHLWAKLLQKKSTSVLELAWCRSRIENRTWTNIGPLYQRTPAWVRITDLAQNFWRFWATSGPHDFCYLGCSSEDESE